LKFAYSLLLLGLLSALAGADPLPGSPLEGAPCSHCHLITDLAGGVPAADASLLVDSQELLCAECHQSAIDTGHPSGFVPQRELPADFPLDFSGYMTCSSCHLIHLPAHGAIRTVGTEAARCTPCHAY